MVAPLRCPWSHLLAPIVTPTREGEKTGGGLRLGCRSGASVTSIGAVAEATYRGAFGTPEAPAGMVEYWLRSRAGTAAFPFALLVLTMCCLAPRSVAVIRQATLADRGALRRIRNRVGMAAPLLGQN